MMFLALGALFRFYNINWGSPFYFHPDERNIASSITQLSFPNQMNPHFFAYGSLPIYAIYFAGLITNLFGKFSPYVSFEKAIIIGRFYSALFSLLLIPILFLIMNKLSDKKAGLLTAVLALFSVGFIQFAHFGTFEMWLTFFTVLLFLLIIKYVEEKNSYYTILLGLVFGILVATKVSHLALLPLPLFAIIFTLAKQKKGTKLYKKLFALLRDLLLFFIASSLLYVITNPFVILDRTSFLSSMNYESTVALGTLKVFYTGGFLDTIPVLFQFLHVYPFLLNPLNTIIFIPAFFYILYKSIKNKNIFFLLLTSFYLLLFFSQAVLYVRWTRYMVPTLPFAYLIIAITISDFLQTVKKRLSIKYLVVGIFVFLNFLFAFSYFVIAFVEPDTRIAASHVAATTMPLQAHILSEMYDLGIVPFNNYFRNITLFNFYDLDNNSPEFTPKALEANLQAADYIILPSQRLLRSRLKDKKDFPKANAFYTSLVNGELGYKKIYETPCDIFCKITYLGNPVFAFEETASVFDRPSVFIYQKIK